MTSQGELVVQEESALRPEIGTALTGAQLRFISNTDFVPAGLRGNLPAIAACVATGRALGIADMNALRTIHIIDGKAAFSAELMVQLVRQRGHSITGDVSAESARVVGRRADNGDTMTVEWTLAMAERAGLLKKQNWVKHPEAMLWARAASALCRMLFADCFAGASYTPEELGAGDITADELMGGEIAGELVAETDATVELISEPQRKRLFAIAGEHGVDTAALKAILLEHTGQESSAAIPREKYDAIVAAVEARVAA